MIRLALLALVTATTGCSSVLGLDAPSFDPCAGGGCADATSPVDASEAGTSRDAAKETDAAGSGGEADAPAQCDPDAQAFPEAGTGVRCGGGCFPLSYCAGATPVCCQVIDDAGVTSFACTSSESACRGYSIRCVNENDCSGTEVCCHFSAHMICDNSTTPCELGCIPGSTQDCPAGKSCDVSLVDGAPYLGCQP